MRVVKLDRKHLTQLHELYNELSGLQGDFNKMSMLFDKLIEKDEYVLIGVEEDDKLLGSIMAVEIMDLSAEGKPFMVIENLIVSQRYRHNGVGKALMDFCETEAKKRGCYYIILVSSAHRKEAHEFYKKLGYSEEGAVGFKKSI